MATTLRTGRLPAPESPAIRLPQGRLHLPLMGAVRGGTAQLAVVTTPDGRRAALGFTDLELLVGALGEHVPWAAWSPVGLPAVLAAAQIQVLLVDSGGPRPRWVDVGPLLVAERTSA